MDSGDHDWGRCKFGLMMKNNLYFVVMPCGISRLVCVVMVAASEAALVSSCQISVVAWGTASYSLCVE